MALRATIWSLLPGASEGKDVTGTYERSMLIGEAKGIRLAHVMATVAATAADDQVRVRSLMQRFVNVPNFKRNPEFALIDAMAFAQMQNISDRMWAQATGTRTPFNSLGKFWDDKASGSDINPDDFLGE
jgi:hypothetical protein